MSALRRRGSDVERARRVPSAARWVGGRNGGVGVGDRSDLPLHVRIHGTGEPIVLVHGFGGNASTWRHWVPGLSASWQVVLVDMKGFGAAPKPRGDGYGPEDQAELIHRLVLERDLKRVTLVGHSLGGGVALLTALRLLDDGEGRLARFVSVDGVAYSQPIPPFVSRARRRWLGRLLLRAWPPRHLVRTVLESIVHDPATVTPEQIEAYAAPLATAEGRRALLEAALRILPEEADRYVSRYSEIDVPALLLWGRHDPVVPLWVAERLRNHLPRARLVLLDRCGHLPPEERPRESLAALVSFLEST